MASIMFGFALKALKNAEKARADELKLLRASGLDLTEEEIQNHAERRYQETFAKEKKRFDTATDFAHELHEMYKEKFERKHSFFITIRPDEKLCDFDMFARKVGKYLERACIIDYTLTYEQKGEAFNELGKGFHCHIVMMAKWRSKGEALRDTQSTFRNICAPNCIDVQLTKNPEDVIQNYMIEYKSEDEHKEKTKLYDTAWRLDNKIKEIYYNEYFKTE